MEKFTASNGVEITLTNDGDEAYLLGKGEVMPGGEGRWTVATGGGEGVAALREFFRHERDQELGRWRWPENPDYVVYPIEVAGHTGGDYQECAVLDESTGLLQEYGSDLPICHGGYSREAARAYFAAHPEPKPWHGAADGQLWLLRFSDFPDVDVSALVKGGLFLYNDHCHEGVAALNDSTIVAARRLWPEVRDV